MDSSDIKKDTKGNYKQPYAPKFINLDEMGRFLERHIVPKLFQEETDYVNSPMCLLVKLKL